MKEETDLERLIRRLKNNVELLNNPDMVWRVKLNIDDIATQLEQKLLAKSACGGTLKMCADCGKRAEFPNEE